MVGDYGRRVNREAADALLYIGETLILMHRFALTKERCN